MFGKRLKELREERGLTQAELAKELGISVQNLSYYENGREPKYELLIKIADYFGVTVDYLIGRSEYRTVEEQFSKRTKFEKFVVENLPYAIWDEKIEKKVATFIEQVLEPLLVNTAIIYFFAHEQERNRDFITDLIYRLISHINLFFEKFRTFLEDEENRFIALDDLYPNDKVEKLFADFIDGQITYEEFKKEDEKIKSKYDYFERVLNEMGEIYKNIRDNFSVLFDFLEDMSRSYSEALYLALFKTEGIFVEKVKEYKKKDKSIDYSKEGESDGNQNT
ncbi:helix-turn-helix domain-containing protein [Caldicellulosiruptor sp. F32]|uniref:helix-turn-helix domain-containing protein n=1 Tax=Caldicellulosiruptor sp. F32 TaxID=1214564 RepID=UPI00039C4E73|nr:helix-turn-helix transcriptional regulator [Caldicellulosiruptor sp. F32]